MIHETAIVNDVEYGYGIVIRPYCVIYACKIGKFTKIGSHCTIGRCTIGAYCKIQDFTVIADGHIVEDEVFIGALVTFCNDRLPKTRNLDGSMQGDGDWKCEPVTVRKGASIGSGAIIGPGVMIGEQAQIASGAVVFHDVPDGAVVIGNPARTVK